MWLVMVLYKFALELFPHLGSRLEIQEIKIVIVANSAVGLGNV